MLRSYLRTYSGLPTAVWLLALVGLINRAGTMVLPFLSIYVTTQLGQSPAVAADAFASFCAGSLVGTVIGGKIADRVDGRVLMAVTLLLNGVGFLVVGQMRDIGLVMLALFLTGVAADAFRPANSAVVARACEPALRGRAFALHRLGVNLGMSVGPALGGVLAGIDYALLFVVDAATCSLAALTVVLSRRSLPAGAASSSSAVAEARSPLADRRFLGVMLGGFVIACIFFQLFSTYPLFLHERRGFSELQIGALITVNTLIITFVQMPLTTWLGHYRPLLPMAAGSVLLGASLGLLPFHPSFAYAVMAMAVFTFGEMAYLPTMNALVTEMAPAAALGRYFGVFSFVMAAAGIVAPWIAMRVYAQVGATTLWLACAALGALTGAGFAAAALLRPGPKAATS